MHPARRMLTPAGFCGVIGFGVAVVSVQIHEFHAKLAGFPT